MISKKKAKFSNENNNSNVEEQVRLLKEDSDGIDISHGKALHDLPNWFDQEKFQRGQRFFRENYYALFVAKLCGLLVILGIPRVLRILMMTQKSSKPSTAFKRYLSTLSHMLLWYNGDIRDKESWAYKSLREVYGKHTSANKRGKAEKKGSVNQSSLAITQFGFMGFGILAPEKLGIKIKDPKDLEGFVHFWRVIGYLIGITEEFNICKSSVEETKMVCKRILDEILGPHLKNPSKDFVEMRTALLQGVWAMVPFIDVEAFVAFTYNLSGMQIPSFTNFYSRFMYNFQKYVHERVLTNRIIGGIMRAFFNFEMWLSVVISSRFPLFAYLTFGVPKETKIVQR